MNFVMKNKYFMLFVLFVSQAFASSPMETEQDEFTATCIWGMETNLTNASGLYKKCCRYKGSSLMEGELQNIINRSASLSRLPKDWQNRFIRHISYMSNQDVNDVDFSSFHFVSYTRGAKKAYVSGMCKMGEGLKSLHESLKKKSIEKYMRPKLYYALNTAIDSDHWTRTDY